MQDGLWDPVETGCRADAKVQFLDTGHFAIETHVAEIGSAMKDFLNANNRTRV